LKEIIIIIIMNLFKILNLCSLNLNVFIIYLLKILYENLLKKYFLLILWNVFLSNIS